MGLIGDLLVGNMLPVSLVEATKFCALLAFVEPSYKSPCCKTMTTRLDTLAAKRRQELQEEIESDATAVAVTIDIWTSLANDPYISFTASYITPSWTMWSGDAGKHTHGRTSGTPRTTSQHVWPRSVQSGSCPTRSLQ